MRKREQYQKPKAKSKIPTLIIMCVTLCVILVFGKSISWKVASIFEPVVPVSDAEVTQPVVAVTDMPQNMAQGADSTYDSGAPAPTKAGAVIYQANRQAAKRILDLISKGNTP